MVTTRAQHRRRVQKKYHTLGITESIAGYIVGLQIRFYTLYHQTKNPHLKLSYLSRKEIQKLHTYSIFDEPPVET